jgi:hypothetical protein
MFGLSKFEWFVLAIALLLCPGFSFGAEPDPVSKTGIVVATGLFA